MWSINIRWYFADTSSTWFFRVSHDTPITTILENQLVQSNLRSTNCSLTVDDIQHPSQVVTGQLLGPVPQDFTLKEVRKKLLCNQAFSNKTYRQFSLVSDLYKINEEQHAQHVQRWSTISDTCMIFLHSILAAAVHIIKYSHARICRRQQIRA